MMLYPNHLDIWYLGDKHKYENKLTKLVSIKCSKNDYVRCSAISPDGTWIVYSTEERLKIFSLIMVLYLLFNIFIFIPLILHFFFFNCIISNFILFRILSQVNQ